jgi:hypothetical protein
VFPVKDWGIGSRKVPRGLRGRHVVKEHQRKLGTSRGSPRHMRICTAKASGISRETVKSRCAREWGGWGRLSDDGPGQNNPDRSEGPWGRAAWSARTEVLTSTSSLTQSREYRWQRRARRTEANRLPQRPRVPSGRPCLTYRPWSRTGENPPYGILGGTVETSASFEARYAPPSYPTARDPGTTLVNAMTK